MSITPELEARALSVEYHAHSGRLPALRGIDLAVAPGAFVAVLGPSGSGKTTLLNVFAGFVRPTSGEARFRGKPISAPSVERAVVFQRHALLPWLDVADNIAFPLKIRGIERSRRRLMVMPLVHRVGLSEFADHPVWTLSGGMQQRVGLARALAADPVGAPPRRAARRARCDHARGHAARPSRPLGRVGEDGAAHHPRHRGGGVPRRPSSSSSRSGRAGSSPATTSRSRAASPPATIRAPSARTPGSRRSRPSSAT